METLLWRMRIGLFRGGRSGQNMNGLKRRNNSSFAQKVNGIIVWLIIVSTLLKILLMIGNVEVNPGPNSKSTPNENSSNSSDDEILTQSTFKQIFCELLSAQMPVILSSLTDKINTIETKVIQTTAKIENLETLNVELKSTNEKLNNQIELMNKRIIDLEDRSRRENLIFYGINVAPGISPKLKLEEFLISKLEIRCKMEGRTHLLPKGKRQHSPIIAQINNSMLRLQILQNSKKLKGTSFWIEEDFSSETRKARQKLKYYMYEARNEGKIPYLNYNKLKIDGETFAEADFPDLPPTTDRKTKQIKDHQKKREDAENLESENELSTSQSLEPESADQPDLQEPIEVTIVDNAEISALQTPNNISQDKVVPLKPTGSIVQFFSPTLKPSVVKATQQKSTSSISGDKSSRNVPNVPERIQRKSTRSVPKKN